ncbi:MAG TPA: GNAT family N-acetyltransferase [Candidatus Dormibacteraeota bacterium]|nr:GNAT family N-acetyltransferase [Candidatus Dormibacteraeota bacterium]
MSLSIRFGALEDVPLIAELIRGLARYEKLEHEVVMTEEKLTATLFGERAYAETLIAEDDDEPVGFALFFHNYSTFLAQPGIYLEDLFVLPEKRSGGVGRALLQRLAQVAVDRGCGRLEWAVLDWNVDAIRFYERLGAKPNADWTIYRLTGESLHRVAGQ